jgi:hypothetical protein
MQQTVGNRLFNWAFIVAAILKVLLVADQEIYGQRFDDMGYALSVIDHYYNCNPNLNWLFIRPLGFPLFGALCMETGIPYRLCIEFFFLAASYFFCTGLRRLVRLEIVPLICLIGLVFHPWTLSGFNQILTEPYFFSLMLLLMGIGVRLIGTGQWRLRNGWLWALGFLIALMMLTRREEPWAFGVLFLLFLIHFCRLRWRDGKPWKQVFTPMLLLLVPIGTYQATILAVSAMNHAKWGIFATNEQEAPGFSGLLDALYRIDTPDPSLWAPVTAKTLSMAIEASPTFAEIRDGLFNTNNPHLEYGEMTTGRKGELGAWMWWRLYDSLAGCGIYTSPKAADDWMRRATAEIEAALDDGRLPARRFSTPFPIDPNIGIWLPEFPQLFLNTLKRLHYAKGEADFTAKEAEIPSMYSWIFDQAANRRKSLLADNSVEVAGFAFSSAGRIDFIAVENGSGEVVAATAPQGYVYWKKPAIERLAGREGVFETSFYLSFIPREAGNLTLSLWKDGQRIHSYPLTDRDYPHRVFSAAAGAIPAADLTVNLYRTPYPDTTSSMKALLRGWAFTAEGPVSHVSMVNAKEQFLKLQAFALQRDDIGQMFSENLGRQPETPLGFHIETPVLDESPVTVQFWRENLLVHQMPLEELYEGYWDTIAGTESGIALTLGIGRRQIPQPVEIVMPLRKQIRAHIAGHYHGYLLGMALLAGLAALALEYKRARGPVTDPWTAGAGLLFILLFVLGRAAFYGLVEAAVVPGVERYMDCVAPVASVFLALLVIGALVILYQLVVIRRFPPRGGGAN